MSTADIPGWEGTIGPGPGQYRQPHVYARDVQSGAGNCVCGRALRTPLHVQAAPGVPIPETVSTEWVIHLDDGGGIVSAPLVSDDEAMVRAWAAEWAPGTHLTRRTVTYSPWERA